MGILAIKAGACCRLERGEKSGFPKCWYVPHSSREDAVLGYNFSLSQPISTAFPPGEVELFRLGLNVAKSFIPLTSQEEQELTLKAKGRPSIFQYPAW